MSATSDGGVSPAGSVDLAPGEDANFRLVLGNVPANFDVIIAELVTGQSAAIELRTSGYWGIISSSDSLDRFVRGRITSVPPATASGQDAWSEAISQNLVCQGPCIVFDPGSGSFYLRVVNTGNSQLTAQVYLYGFDLADEHEPGNDSRNGAAPLADGESGAIELLGDVDYWTAGFDTNVTISQPTGISVEASVYDTCGLAVAGPYDGGETFSVFQGESVRVRAVADYAATSGRSAYFITLDPFSGVPRPPGCQEVTANQSSTSAVGSVSLTGSAEALFVLSVPSSVRQRDLLQIEITKDAVLEVLATSGGTVLYSSTSRNSFNSGSTGSAAVPGLDGSAVSVRPLCRGSCVVINGAASEYLVRVRNDGSAGTISLYAFGRDFDDSTEPANDDPESAPVITDDGSGAIEYVGDEDIWLVAFDGLISFSAVSGAIPLVATVHAANGFQVAGPYSPGSEFQVYVDEYVLVRAVNPTQAAVSGKSTYYLF